MSIRTISEILSEHTFFKELEPRYGELIAGCGRNVHFKDGEFISREGQPADSFYLIRHGTVALELHSPSRGTITIQTLHEGDVLGWSWLVPPFKWQFDAKAMEIVRAVEINGACLRKKCDEDHELGYVLMKRVAEIMSHRLNATRLQLLDLYGPHQ